MNVFGQPSQAAAASAPSVMTDPLMQPIIQGADARMDDLVSGFNNTVNLGVGAAALAAGAGVALGSAAIAGALARGDAPYDSLHLSNTREPAVDTALPAQSVQSDSRTVTPDMVAADPVIGNMGLPQRALDALAAITQQHGNKFAFANVSERSLSDIVPTAQRDGAAERMVHSQDNGLGAVA